MSAAPKRPGTAYKRGTNLERRIQKDLEAEGYLVCRSAGSGGIADLWAKRNEEPLLLIQVRRQGNMSPREWNWLLDAAVTLGAWAIVASAAPRKPVCYIRLLGYCAPYSRDRLCEEVDLSLSSGSSTASPADDE
jgi:Archaeal holliday junction resolvase (hjc)